MPWKPVKQFQYILKWQICHFCEISLYHTGLLTLMHIFEWTHVLPFILGHGSKLSHCECRKGIHKLIIQNCKPVFKKSEKIGNKTFTVFFHLAAAPQAEVKVEIIWHYKNTNLILFFTRGDKTISSTLVTQRKSRIHFYKWK